MEAAARTATATASAKRWKRRELSTRIAKSSYSNSTRIEEDGNINNKSGSSKEPIRPEDFNEREMQVLTRSKHAIAEVGIFRKPRKRFR